MNQFRNRIKLLDGIRGLAILIVLLYHFYPQLFPGGYSGVDIFFMLSGFLITKAILKINSNNDKYNLIEFYKSRFLRIFPAILILILFVLTIGLILQETDELIHTAKHAIYSTTQIMNFMLWHEAGYFDIASKFKVFLHMWSLSIEWQLYLTAPIIVLFLSRIISSIKVIGLLTLSCSIILMLFFLYAAENHPVGAYYFTPLRSWSFLLGASLYLLENRINKNTGIIDNLSSGQFTYNSFLLVTVGALLLNILILPSYLNYGLINVISVFFVSLLIIFKPKFPINLPLTFFGRLFIFLGLISFSLYLWHWPILYFIRLMGWDSYDLTLVIGIIITLLFSWFSYKYIEYPFNNSTNKNLSIVITLVLGLLVISISSVLIVTGGVKSRYEENILIPTSNKLIEKCQTIASVEDSYCKTTKEPKVVLLGDSHADLLMNALIESKHKLFSKVISITAGNCHPSIDTESRKGCNKQINETLLRIKEMPEIKYALITSWNQPINQSNVDEYLEGYSKLFETLFNYGIKPIFLIDNPTLNKSPRSCSRGLYSTYFRKNLSKKDSFCFDLTKENFIINKEYNYLVNKLSENYKDILFINSFDLICPDLNCSLIQDNQVIYSDEGHLSYFSSKKVVANLLSIVEMKNLTVQ